MQSDIKIRVKKETFLGNFFEKFFDQLFYKLIQNYNWEICWKFSQF